MSELYRKLKPFHIQQDKYDGCSLGSFLMLKNAHLKRNQTQAEFRQELTDLKMSWVDYVNGREYVSKNLRNAHGVASARLRTFIGEYLEKSGCKMHVGVQRINARVITLDTFRDMLQTCNRSKPSRFIIFNYDSHHSPLGQYDLETDMITILDVDYSETYEKEFHYQAGEGEYKITARDFFYKKLRRQHRAFLVLSEDFWRRL